MIRRRYWHQIPAAPLVPALQKLTWQRVGEISPASSIAALMIYVALNFSAEERAEVGGRSTALVAASYDDLQEATGISRSLVAQGLQRLVDLALIRAVGSHQKRRYEIARPEDGWFKLPCQAIVSGGVITPFQVFTLRSRHELHALKLYLYLASVRDNKTPFSQASFETIHEKIGIPERHIKKASSLLINSGLLSDVGRDHVDGYDARGANKYFLKGYRNLFTGAGEAVTVIQPQQASLMAGLGSE